MGRAILHIKSPSLSTEVNGASYVIPLTAAAPICPSAWTDWPCDIEKSIPKITLGVDGRRMQDAHGAFFRALALIMESGESHRKFGHGRSQPPGIAQFSQ
jgi:hypothetical protein